MQKEAHNLIDVVANARPEIITDARRCVDKTKKKDPDWAYRALALHYTLQEKETACLKVMEKVAKHHGWQIDCLIHDGGLLRMRGVERPEPLLRAMEAEIKKEKKLEIQLVVKPFEKC